MANIPIYVLAGQSNADLPGLDAALVDGLEARGSAFELVKVAEGGTSLQENANNKEDWSPQSSDELLDELITNVYERMVYIVSQGHKPILADVFWNQKEADASVEAYANNYSEALSDFKSAFYDRALQLEVGEVDNKVKLVAWDTEFVVAQMADDPTPLAQEIFEYNHVIRQEQACFASADDQVRLVDENLVEFRNEDFHYSMLGRFQMGELMISATSDLAHAGADYVSLTAGRTIMLADSLPIELTLWGDDTIIGTAGDDFWAADDLRKDDLSDSYDSLTRFGDDTFFAGSGNDTLYGGFQNDQISGGDGTDILHGSGNPVSVFNIDPETSHLLAVDEDTINGGAGTDALFGYLGDDKLNGGDGNDKLYGQWGNDVLIGGFGSDQFRFTVDSGRDVIADFEGNDVIVFDSVYSDFSEIMVDAEQVGEHVHIRTDTTDRISIQNTLLSELDSGDFVFL